MRKVIQLFGLPLAISLGLALLLTMLYVPIVLYEIQQGNYYNAAFENLVKVVSIAEPLLLVATFGLGVAYILIGVFEYVAAEWGRKNAKESSTYAKRMVLRGVMGVAVSLLLYVIVTLIILSLYGEPNVSGSRMPNFFN